MAQLSHLAASRLASVVPTVLAWVVAALALLALAWLLVMFLRRSGAATSPADRPPPAPDADPASTDDPAAP